MSSHRSAAYTQENHKEYMKVYNGWYRRVNREGILVKKRRYREANSQKRKERNRKKNEEIRLMCLNHYSNGTMKCAECDVNDIDMLLLDHINDDGAEHRRNIGGTGSLYAALMRLGFPHGIQVLCANHNHKKEIERRRKLSCLK
jgi:hypothetical protein